MHPDQPASPIASEGHFFPVDGKDANYKVNFHHGVNGADGATDIFAPEGTPVRSVFSGEVVNAGWNELGGWSVSIKQDDGLVAYYAHLENQPMVQAGQRVDAGQQIGVVGDTGNAAGTGAHLHFGLGKDIQNGSGAEGGAGTDFNAVAFLQDILKNGERPDTATA